MPTHTTRMSRVDKKVLSRSRASATCASGRGTGKELIASRWQKHAARCQMGPSAPAVLVSATHHISVYPVAASATAENTLEFYRTRKTGCISEGLKTATTKTKRERKRTMGTGESFLMENI